VDIGAHDGVCGSNSRALLEKGWRGVLVEPLPRIFEKLKQNSRQFPEVALLELAVSNERGFAQLAIGRDGDLGQMSSLSHDPGLSPNLSGQVIQVRTATLADVLDADGVPQDFGVLLVDAEGWDLTVLQGLEHTSKRPRLIVTENFTPTNDPKYRLLAGYGYDCVGFWGGDSFWVLRDHADPSRKFCAPVHRCPPEWTPSGQPLSSGAANLDEGSCFQNSVAGWAWNERDTSAPEEVFLKLENSTTKESITFEAWRNPRPDVAQAFNSDALMFSGFRAFCDVSAGSYEATVIQSGEDYFIETPIGAVSIPR
jgi:FkbM family methyltransferase